MYDSNEHGGDENRSQQSQEKPLRMFYNGKNSDEKHSKSIENYIDAHLANDDLDDTAELYLKRRNSMETESEVEGLKPNTKTRYKDRLLVHDNVTQRQSKQRGKPLRGHEKYTVATFVSKPAEVSDEVPIPLDDFVANEVDSFENDLNNLDAGISDLDRPKYQQIEVLGSLTNTEVPSEHDVSSGIQSLTGNSLSPGVDSREHPSDQERLSRPYQIVSRPLSEDQFSFKMVSNQDPSDPLVFKTSITQNHAPIAGLRPNYHSKFKTLRDRKLSRLYPLKSDCKPGKVYNRVLCSMPRSLSSSAPIAISYQQQEFFRSVKPGT